MLELRSELFSALSETRNENIGALLSAKKEGKKVIGHYCAYSPVELALAAGAIAVPLCGNKKEPFLAADNDLPPNLCPIIRSSYDLAVSDTCPFFHASDMIVAETTCDGKKKMYEILQRIKPIHVMNLPQIPDLPMSITLWKSEVRRLKTAIEKELGVKITDEALREAIHVTNEEARARKELFDLNRNKPALLSGKDLLVIVAQAGYSIDRMSGVALIDRLTEEIKKKAQQGYHVGNEKTPRILLTGTPLGENDDKVVSLVEEYGGLVVAMEICGGYKSLDLRIDETDCRDPILLLAEKQVGIPCSVMSPNKKRIQLLERMIHDFAVDGVVDLTWHGCHTYNIESYWVADLVKNKLEKPFLHLTTDFSDADRETMRVRIEAFLEMI
ncbi:MAG: double-cubane-cluster-containing anaerobic reductase [Thermodesulfobacteriota bacterium]|jgi:benzoyl-CoA reductase/2-hydroxyglutaryl-CoA dehydratase subunit BcrC/BadD/HgdB|nr:MAG: double-cubane-cluster-containing anaerobic reductase [Thermodesulfobacteriota bacterium]